MIFDVGSPYRPLIGSDRIIVPAAAFAGMALSVYPDKAVRTRSRESKGNGFSPGPKLTSGLQVGGRSPIFHPEFSRLSGFLEGGEHVGARSPVARVQTEGRVRHCRGRATQDDGMRSLENVDFALSRGGHGAVLCDDKLRHDVVDQEQTYGVLLCHGVPGPRVLRTKDGGQPRGPPDRKENSISSRLTLFLSKFCTT